MRTLLVVLLALATADAGAVVLYKLTDTLGNVTFSDNVPAGFRGSVDRLDIETGSNLISPSPAGPSVLRSPVDERLLAPPRPDNDSRLRAAEARVQAARAALDDAHNNSTAEDWVYYRRNSTTGASRMPGPEYAERLERLAANVVVAEAEYDTLRRELR